MSKFTPWTKEQAEAWAEEITNPLNMSDSQFSEEFRVQKERGKSLFLAGLAKAAEMIEASPTVYRGELDCTDVWIDAPWYPPGGPEAKLICPQLIEEEPFDDQA